jgi:hypothetical protein
VHHHSLCLLAHSDDPTRLIFSSLLFFFSYCITSTRSIASYIPALCILTILQTSQEDTHSTWSRKLDVFVATQNHSFLNHHGHIHQLCAINQKPSFFIFIVSVLLHLSLPAPVSPYRRLHLGLVLSVCLCVCFAVLSLLTELIFVYRYVPFVVPCRSNHDLYMFYASLLFLPVK